MECCRLAFPDHGSRALNFLKFLVQIYNACMYFQKKYQISISPIGLLRLCLLKMFVRYLNQFMPN